MFGLLAGLSVWMASLASQSQGFSAGPAPEVLAQSDISIVTTRINGRNVKVQVQLYRNLMPIIGTTAGDQTLIVRVSTPDQRGLPVISSLRATVINQRRQTWVTTPRPVPTLVFDRRSMMYSAGNGPMWAVGSPVTVRVEIRSGSRTTTVNVPARINAVF
jgi:hypothetical protein